jgi:hypothetical protein
MNKKNLWWLFEEDENEKPKVKQKDKIETKEDLKKLMEVLESFVRNTFGIKVKINKLVEVHPTRDSRNFIFEAGIEGKILSFYAKSKSGINFGVNIETGGIALREGGEIGEIVFALWIEKEEAKVLANEKYFVKILHK